MFDFLALAQECAPTVAPKTMAAIVNVESNYNPYAIGVVGGHLIRQPKNREEAVATAKALAAKGWNFSLGVAQVNHHNLPKYHLNYEQAFNTCKNLYVGSKILEDCYRRASKRTTEPQTALKSAISCYYSGNFTRGFHPDGDGRTSYVQRVLTSADKPVKAIPVVPEIKPNGSVALHQNNDSVQLKPIFKKPASIEQSSRIDTNSGTTSSTIVF